MVKVFSGMVLLLGLSSLAAEPTAIKARPAEVTLYRNRAGVLFSTKIQLQKGKHTLEHRDAVPSLIPESLRATADSEQIVIQGISSFLDAAEPARQPEIQELQARVQQMDREILRLEYDEQRIQTDIEGINKYYELLNTALARQATGAAEAREQARTVLIDRKLKQTASLGETRENLRKKNEEVGRLRRDLAEKKDRLSHRRRTVQITLYAHEPATFQLGYHAILPDAGWNVSYSLRLSGQPELKYYAEAFQKTGMDWTGVQLFFSTAEPQLASERPPLRPLSASLMQAQDNRNIVVEQEAAEEVLDSEIAEPESTEEARLVFKAGQATLKSGNEKHLFLLATFQPELSDSFLRVAGRAATGTVYRLKHRGDSPLLAGPVDLIKSTGWSGRSYLKRTPPGVSFELSTAGAANIKQDRSVTHRRESSLGGKQIFHTIIRNSLQNRSREKQRIEIQERLPVSELAEVNVELQDAGDWQEKSPGSGIRSRQMHLEPGQKWSYEFHYTVTAPQTFQGTLYGD